MRGPQLPHLLADLGAAIVVGDATITIAVPRRALAKLSWVGDDIHVTPEDTVTITLAISHKRRGHEMRLVYAAPGLSPVERDPRLVQLIASGRAAYDDLWSGAGDNDAIRRSHLTRLARLRFLAPDIVMSILEGRQPVELTARTLMRIADLPLCWKAQRRVLGYP